jgi:hypothetical protein
MMSVEHCGKPQETPYCAYCGELLDATKVSIQGLKRHIDITVAASEKAVAEYPPDSHLLKSRTTALAKWQGWQTALKELMDDASKQKEG